MGAVSLIVEFARGFPRLALELAAQITQAPPGAPLLDLTRKYGVAEILGTMIPDPRRRQLLGYLGLFDRFGFDQTVAAELAAIATAFGIDHGELRALVEQETGKFVSTAGRYRRVSPKLLALSLAADALATRRDQLEAALATLPPDLLSRFLDRLGDFAGSPIITDFVIRFLADVRHRSLRELLPSTVRFISAAAVVAPAEALGALSALIGQSSDDVLRELKGIRRYLVDALQYLLWFEPTYPDAIALMYRLARNENEDWDNNASGIFRDSFQFYLGATAVPAGERLAWLRQMIARDGPAASSLALSALKRALQGQDLRSHVWPGARTPVVDWRPATRADFRRVWLDGWDMLIGIAKASEDDRARVAQVIQRVIRQFPVEEDGWAKLEADLRTVPWAAVARAAIAEGLLSILQYDKPPADLHTEIQAFVTYLRGADLQERLATAMGAPPWDHVETEEEGRRSGGTPRFLRELGEELFKAPEQLRQGIEQIRAGDAATAHALGYEIGARDVDGRLYDAFATPRPIAVRGLIGYVVARAQPDAGWVDERLKEWSSDDDLAALLPETIRHLPPSGERAERAIATVEAGRAPSVELAGFLYGGWLSGQPAAIVERVLDALSAGGTPYEIESAMAILDGWLGKAGNEATPSMRDRALLLIERGYGVQRPMIGYHRAGITKRAGFEFDQRLGLVLTALRRDGPAEDEDLKNLAAVVDERPEEAVKRTVPFIVELENDRFGMGGFWIQESHLLSRMVAHSSVDVVMTALESERTSWSKLVQHIVFATDDPPALFIAMLSSGADEATRAAARTAFIRPERVTYTAGPAELEKRRAVAVAWAASADPNLAAWARTLVPIIDETIAQERIDSDETYFR
jgi:hypothetical protein